MASKPRFYRPAKNNHFSWEIYRPTLWFINIAFGNFEIQLNKWVTPGTAKDDEI